MNLRCPRVQAAALGIATALCLGGGILAATNVSASIDGLIAATTRARLQVEATQAVLATVRDAELGQRGYLLTGRPAYLEPYAAAMAQVGPRLDRLHDLARGTPWLEAASARLATAARGKAAAMQRAVDLAATNGLPAAVALVDADPGRAAMDDLSDTADQIAARAEADRAGRARTLQGRQSLVTTFLLLGLGAATVLLGASALVLLWNRNRLLRAREGERRQAARLHAAVEHVPDGLAVFDRDRKLTLANDRFAATLGIDPAFARPGTPLAAIAHAARLGAPVLPEAPPAQASGTEAAQDARTLQLWRSPMPEGGQMLAVADLTRRVAAEEAARQSQKMDVLGQMTGGVAHDFNNLLQVVSANLELLRGRLETAPHDAAMLARLDDAAAGVARGAKLTRHLLAFARRQPLAPEPIDPARQLHAMADMLRRTLGAAVTLRILLADTPSAPLWHMCADPTQFENALLNLALNARDAMTGPGGTAKGTLTIDVANTTDGPADYVAFTITDTGAGMTAEQCSRAVEPFYTTKPEGRGTGLGLAMVLGFATQSGGRFHLRSEPGHGTAAHLLIPRTTALARRPDAAPANMPRGHGEAVLLVENDAAVRAATRDALLALGYAVTEAGNADDALARIEAGDSPRLLFTDIVLPGQLSARDMVGRARTLVPGLRVLFTSATATHADGPAEPGTALIGKPWRQTDLARILRRVLDPGLDQVLPARPQRRRILLVEDEQLVRASTADALAGLGYDVVEAPSATDALARLAPAPDLLITDQGLPDLDGAGLAASVRDRIPGLPVILSSGQSEPPAGAPAGSFVWLPKPYDIEALRDAIAQAFA